MKITQLFPFKMFFKLLAQFNLCQLTILYVLLLCNFDLALSQFSGFWKTGEWSECSGSACGPGGLQIRGVTCQDSQLHIEILKSNCNQTQKPNDQKECFRVCSKHEYMYRWNIGSWQMCKVLNSIKNEHNCNDSLIGIQMRDVTCVNVANISLVVEKAVCSKFVKQPTVRRSCTLPCPKNCVTSSFGPWSKCFSTCGNSTQIRFRSILDQPKYGGMECPQLFETKLCEEPRSCVQQSSNILYFSSWSVCHRIHRKLLPRNIYVKEKKRNHLIGMRTKTLSCCDQRGEEISKSFNVSEMCIRMIDCSVSSWSNWSACSVSCGKHGTQIRSRSIKRLPQGINALSCPKLFESKSCDLESKKVKTCPRHMWLAGSWSKCDLVFNTSCGGGLQSRDVYCVRIGGETSEEILKSFLITANNPAAAFPPLVSPVQESNCKSITKPKRWRRCDVSCRFKCDIGPWSRWSQCALSICAASGSYPSNQNFRRQTKRSRGFKRRVRKVHHAYGAPEDCPHLAEFLPCLNARCFNWHVTDTSLCQPTNGVCGNGTITRQVECRDMWENSVDKRWCRGSPVVSRIVTCRVPCSEDCVLSNWGPWSPCPLTCRQGRKKSGIQTRTRYIAAFSGPHGVACLGDDALTDSRPCNQHKCPVYYWNALRWNPCYGPDNSTGRSRNKLGNEWVVNNNVIEYYVTDRSQVCEFGHQERKVVCKKKRSGRVGERFCIASMKPSTTRRCRLPCHRDCLLSEWGAWSSCAEQCSQVTRGNLSTVPPVYQQRQRFVIQHRSAAGLPCLLETEQTRLCPPEQQCAIYQWRTSEWGSCLIAVGMRSIDKDDKCPGVRTRAVSCVLFTSDGVQFVSRNEFCFQNAGAPPFAASPCRTKCPENVAFTRWKRETPCRVSATSSLTFKINETVQSRNPSTPSRPASKPVGLWSSCVSDPVILQDLDSDCLAPEEMIRDPLMSISGDNECGAGIRKRALGCFEGGSGFMYETSYCNYDAFDWERCQIQCAVDCEMSDWNRWGKCGNLSEGKLNGPKTPSLVFCGENIKLRFRYLVERPRGGGRKCPTLDENSQEYQSSLCHNECQSYFWSAENNWKTCDLTQKNNVSRCGKGVKVQSPICYRGLEKTGFVKSASVVKRGCDMDKMPYGSLVCHLPCTNQCVLSHWSPWQPCSSHSFPCQNATRKRTRVILREPVSNPGLKCDRRGCKSFSDEASAGCGERNKLVDEEMCELNINCFTYRAEWAPWTGCLLSADAKCGSGFKKRKSNCFRSDGIVVSASRCGFFNVDLPKTQILECDVACPIDCLLSDWSMWSLCSATCGSRVRRRARQVVREASSLGRPCGELEQVKPCCWKPCYSWKLLGWGGCALEFGECGVGVEERIAVCVQEDNSTVDPRLCRQQRPGMSEIFDQFPSFMLVRPCHVICPWVCRESDWSHWSSCQETCYKREKTSITSRMRFKYFFNQVGLDKCPSPVIETSSCPQITCFNNRSQIPKLKVLVEETKMTDLKSTTPITSPLVSFSSLDRVNSTDTSGRSALDPLNDDGSLKVWAYAAIAGFIVLLIFIVAVTYLLCSACHRTGNNHQKRERSSKWSGSNAGVGMTPNSAVGSLAYDVGSSSVPPYYVSTRQTNNGSPDFRIPSSRRARHISDDYDDLY